MLQYLLGTLAIVHMYICMIQQRQKHPELKVPGGISKVGLPANFLLAAQSITLRNAETLCSVTETKQDIIKNY